MEWFKYGIMIGPNGQQDQVADWEMAFGFFLGCF